MNRRVARDLGQWAALIELTGGESGKAAALKRAAEAVRRSGDVFSSLVEEGHLQTLGGVGPKLADALERLATGQPVEELERLRRSVPVGVRDLLGIAGLGPKTVRPLWEQGIDSSAELLRRIRRGEETGIPSGRLREILPSLEERVRFADAVTLGEARHLTSDLSVRLAALPGVTAAWPVGAIRRGEERVEEPALLLVSTRPAETGAALESLGILPGEDGYRWDDPTGPFVRVVVTPEPDAGWALVRETGPQAHVAVVEGELARLGRQGPFPTEEAVYAAIRWPLPPAERRREGPPTGPPPVSLAEMQGDLHCHTLYSDGSSSLAAMAEAARAVGYRYLAVSDHSQSLRVAHGLTPERYRAQWEEMETLNRSFDDGFQILRATEVEILTDGRLDLPDDLLQEFDWVTASIHTGFNDPPEQIRQRIGKAMAHPLVDAIGHPTGRMLRRRAPYAVAMPWLFEEAERTGTVLEINGSERRMDLSARHVEAALEFDVQFVIDSDAHSPRELGNLAIGVSLARGAAVPAFRVVNTRDRASLERSRKRHSH